MELFTHCIDLLATTLRGSRVELADVCNALLTALRDGRIEARGYRRQSSTEERPIHSIYPSLELVSIPTLFWERVPEVDNSGVGSWLDDEEKPDEWSNADWFAGEFSVVEWTFEPELMRVFTAFYGVRLNTQQALEVVSGFNELLGRSPSFKKGRPPPDEVILAKINELRSRGMDRDQIAKNIRFEPGFETCGNAEVRQLMKGLFPPGPRSRM